jgi:hypothetical protein
MLVWTMAARKSLMLDLTGLTRPLGPMPALQPQASAFLAKFPASYILDIAIP